jgi:protein-disulfide isomerase
MNQKSVLYLLLAAFIMVTAVFGALRLANMFSSDDVPSSAMSKTDVEKIVRNYLIQNPEVIFEAVEGMKAKEEGERIAGIRDRAKSHKTQLFAEADPLVAGNPKGDVTIVEFFDYRCGYCRKVRKDLVDLLNQDGNIRLVLKEMPILSAESQIAAQAAIASTAQGKYWDYHMALLAAEDLDEARIFEIAKSVGIDVARLKVDMGNPKVMQRLRDTQKLAQALGIDATPTFFIGDEPFSGAQTLQEMKDAVAAARKAKPS